MPYNCTVYVRSYLKVPMFCTLNNSNESNHSLTRGSVLMSYIVLCKRLFCNTCHYCKDFLLDVKYISVVC
jgi:hypothetical protein